MNRVEEYVPPPTRHASELNKVGVICTLYARALICSVLVVAVATRVNLLFSSTFETSANSRECAVRAIVELIRCALGRPI